MCMLGRGTGRGGAVDKLSTMCTLRRWSGDTVEHWVKGSVRRRAVGALDVLPIHSWCTVSVFMYDTQTRFVFIVLIVYPMFSALLFIIVSLWDPPSNVCLVSENTTCSVPAM